MSTQLKVRLISAAPSCVAVDFISIATRNISERATTNNLIHVTILRSRYRRIGELAYRRFGLVARNLPGLFSFERQSGTLHVGKPSPFTRASQADKAGRCSFWPDGRLNS